MGDSQMIRALQLADMTVVGAPPPKLLKACAVVADQLHPTFAQQRRMAHPDKSKDSCVLCSLAVRDFLLHVGFPDARVRPVAVVMAAYEGMTQLHSLGIGMPGTAPSGADRWAGHMVVEVAGWLIDLTLYPAVRPQWRNSISGMLALPFGREGRVLGLDVLAIVATVDGDYRFEIAYLDNPGNMRWRVGPDAVDVLRRKRAVRAMRAKFGKWGEP